MKKAREYLENKYPQMRGEKWNTHEVINDEWIAEQMEEYANLRQSSPIRATV